MKTMLEILMTAPPDQVTRCKIAMVEIAHGHWDAAASTLEDAIYESEPGEWAVDCMEMREFCLAMDKVKSQGIKGVAGNGADKMEGMVGDGAERMFLGTIQRWAVR